ncbi:unnamed protein product [Rhizophagus irregularis]|nr:unnamed protein product [Rhizophagus irregularis]
MATTSAHDSDDNFSDASSDVTDYFKEEGTNESTEEVSKKSEVIAKAGDDDDVYFYSEDEEVKGANEEVPKVPDMVDDDSDCSHDNDSEKEMPDDSDDDGYNDYGGYNEYGERDRDPAGSVKSLHDYHMTQHVLANFRKKTRIDEYRSKK